MVCCPHHCPAGPGDHYQADSRTDTQHSFCLCSLLCGRSGHVPRRPVHTHRTPCRPPAGVPPWGAGASTWETRYTLCLSAPRAWLCPRPSPAWCSPCPKGPPGGRTSRGAACPPLWQEGRGRAARAEPLRDPSAQSVLALAPAPCSSVRSMCPTRVTAVPAVDLRVISYLRSYTSCYSEGPCSLRGGALLCRFWGSGSVCSPGVGRWRPSRVRTSPRLQSAPLHVEVAVFVSSFVVG